VSREGAQAASNARCLVVGHGSVGSFLAARLLAAGAAVSILDPEPRIPIVAGRALENPASLTAVDYVFSCVPAEASESVPALVRPALGPDGVLFDWNTVSPAVKRRIAAATEATTVDVALLDSLDAEVERPTLALSGPTAEHAAAVLEGFGFRAFVAGTEVGDAAALKYLRSIFMKGLEALVLEYASLATDFGGAPIVRASLKSNLGEQFVRFMDLLIATNRIHARRRSRELADAVATFSSDGARPNVAAASARVLRLAAETWADESAPPIGADVDDLARHLRPVLWPEQPST
jgi:3-hydroxyisobutyrate dehydrogenase-like beta-hydroxyacid dehydrogenase